MNLKKFRTACISILLSITLVIPAYVQAASDGPGIIGLQESKLQERLGQQGLLRIG